MEAKAWSTLPLTKASTGTDRSGRPSAEGRPARRPSSANAPRSQERLVLVTVEGEPVADRATHPIHKPFQPVRVYVGDQKFVTASRPSISSPGSTNCARWLRPPRGGGRRRRRTGFAQFEQAKQIYAERAVKPLDKRASHDSGPRCRTWGPHRVLAGQQAAQDRDSLADTLLAFGRKT